MFVYTFENIQRIKDLKHSTEVKSKHAKKIKKINKGMFKDFNYDEFKDEQPPKNESLQTYNELLNFIFICCPVHYFSKSKISS